MEAVSNTTCLILLAKLDRLGLLQNVFKKILIPPEVKWELFAKVCPETIILGKAIGAFIFEFSPKKIKSLPLDSGEQSAISLCLENPSWHFLSDDKRARSFARSLGIKTIGVIGVLLKNLSEGKVTKEEAKGILHELVRNGLYISTDLFTKVEELIEG